MTRTGAGYLEAIQNDGRRIYMDGETVTDVVHHPAFSGVAESVARLYDASAGTSCLTFASPTTGSPVHRAFLVPRSRDDLSARRQASTIWAELTYGFLGRSPDHVASILTGFSTGLDVFARGGPGYAENVRRFYEAARENDWYVAYTIVPPQMNRTKNPGEWQERNLAAGVFREADGGITIRGAQMLGTAAAIADWLFVSCIHPLRAGDEDYAISLVIPMAAPGLKLYCRKSYANGQHVFDYPLSTQVDESDALVVFDDVFVPWEQVFVYRNPELVRAQFFETPAHVLANTQAQTRFITKLKFIAGLARAIAKANGVEALPPVQGQLGDLVREVAVVEAMVMAAEYQAAPDARGIMVPNRQYLYTAMAQQPDLYNRVIRLIRELAGGGVLQLPASYLELLRSDTRGDMDRYVRSGDLNATERVKLFKLAWDVIGSEFAGRHLQYEMFYGGAPFLTKTWAYHNYPFQDPDRLVAECLSRYDLPET